MALSEDELAAQITEIMRTSGLTPEQLRAFTDRVQFSAVLADGGVISPHVKVNLSDPEHGLTSEQAKAVMRIAALIVEWNRSDGVG